MRIPYVIDNETHRRADVLNEVLAGHAGRSLDVTTAYSTVSAYAQVRERVAALGTVVCTSVISATNLRDERNLPA